MILQYGTPEQNPQFWASISPNSYLGDLSGPIQLHHNIANSFGLAMQRLIQFFDKYVKQLNVP